MNNSTILKSKIFNILLICAFFLTLGAFPTKGFSQEKASGQKEEKFDAGKTAMEHIADKHEWHLFGEKVVVPLPIILYTDKGFEFFSSANFNPEGNIYKGKYYNYSLVHDKVKAVDQAGNVDVAATKKVWDFSITQNIAGMWLSGLVLIFVFLNASSAYRKRVGKAPKGLQSFVEPIILFIRDDVARPNIGVNYERFMPLLLTVFFFILINNFFGMIPFFPGGYNLTGNIAVTFTLAFIIFLVINLNGNKHYWKHIFSPNPWWLFPIMIPVEIVGIFSKPIALMIRLFANMLAGHIVIISLISLIFIFNTIWIAPVSVGFALFIDVIEVLVVFLQAYVFTILSALFIGMAVQEHHDTHQEVI
ncbi:MAG TPA: F0F1 ATP synthase subunit A [Mucilaginibacter sp.]|jgi:F-type H+-transporting ATPase subunit a|nr:F0F1 ATP synthase subunit A [Mucilaginibacter sp.]